MALITFTTDFGLDDWFVATIKGVVLGINPRGHIVDLTHGIPPGDIRAAAFALAAGCRFFPKGTIHVAIVDPGVGSERRAIAIQTSDYVFVGPDNGILSWALRKKHVLAIHLLENESLFLQPVSHTFHGRDVFAPVAAHLSRGVPLAKLGRKIKNFESLAWPEPTRSPAEISGEIAHVDRFGNCITNIEARMLPDFQARNPVVFAGRRRLCSAASFYAAVPPGSAVAVLGSSGLLEIAVNGGSASKRLRLKRGSKVTIRLLNA